MLKKKITAMVTLIAMLVTSMSISITAFAANDVTATYNPVTVNKVDDITLTSIATNVQSVYADCSNMTEATTYNYYYTFKLDKPSYVELTTFADVVEWNFNSDLHVYLSTSKMFNEEVISSWMNGETQHYRQFLEAGTYYVKMAAEIHDADFIENKMLNMTVYAQEAPRSTTALGYSKNTAIVLGNNKGVGMISRSVRSQWFKFTISSKSDVTFTTTFEVPSDWGMDNYKYAKLYDADGVEIGEDVVGSNKYSTFECTSFKETVKELPAGTYYVEVFVGGERAVKVNHSIKVVDKYAPNKPKAITYKSGSKFVKGNAEKGTTVYVKYNGKTTKAVTDKYGVYKVNTSALKVGKTIQIWAKDAAGNKSKVTKVTVKNRQIAKPKVKTYKKNTKLVKGTAKKGTTVHVTYAGKTYKKKLTSTSYSVKVNKKLTKGASIKVKVVDSYGNYSKTVTVKVK